MVCSPTVRGPSVASGVENGGCSNASQAQRSARRSVQSTTKTSTENSIPSDVPLAMLDTSCTHVPRNCNPRSGSGSSTETRSGKHKTVLPALAEQNGSLGGGRRASPASQSASTPPASGPSPPSPRPWVRKQPAMSKHERPIAWTAVTPAVEPTAGLHMTHVSGATTVARSGQAALAYTIDFGSFGIFGAVPRREEVGDARIRRDGRAYADP